MHSNHSLQLVQLRHQDLHAAALAPRRIRSSRPAPSSVARASLFVAKVQRRFGTRRRRPVATRAASPRTLTGQTSSC